MRWFCATAALFAALALSAPAAHADDGNACVAYGGTACQIITFTPTPATPEVGFDDSGDPGPWGTQAPSVTHTFQNNTSYSAVLSGGSKGAQPGVVIGAYSGGGANGADASNGQLGAVDNLNAGNGGNGGLGGDVTVTLASGSSMQILGLAASTGNGAFALWAESWGGGGGNGGLPTEGGLAGVSGTGANGGNVTVTASNNANTIDPQSGLTGGIIANAIGIYARSLGGSGGNGTNHIFGYAKAGVDGSVTGQNPPGASNGWGGEVNVTVDTSVLVLGTTIGAGVWAVSAGGNGGTGGTGSDVSVGGNGGNGGDAAPGGPVLVTVTQNGSISAGQQASGATSMPGIWAQSMGGIGGMGGNASGFGSGGDGGNGADGGLVTITNNGTIATGLANSPGILAQSFGGAGPGGGTGGGWGASGGEGASGGNGGQITILGSGGIITTSGTNSPGSIAQSIGAGGGNGGDSDGWLSIGGAGAVGGNGGSVTVNIQNTITTTGERSGGIVAQSIGGGGGNGGNASGTGVGLNLNIGGSGAGGGNGGTVQATTGGMISTAGAHSSGLVMQSIGGGGGNGGAAYSKDYSGGAGASVAIGGTGGVGGPGGTISQIAGSSGPIATNTGEISTTGPDSFGILAQSIGGGGGVGGASTAHTITYALNSDPPLPTLSLSVAIGGAGGTGGDGGPVTLANGGLIATSAPGSAGIVAQSIGGGGGNGGDSSSAATAKSGEDTPFTFSAAVSLGGSSSAAGAGNPVTATNSGLILTSGESADGMLLQSIGGGGGSGGSGDAKAKSQGDATGLSTTLSIGGGGNSGGGANVVTATNSGAILTLGDGAVALMAQAVGGGGGRGGGGAGTSNGTFHASAILGGTGGNGGDGGPSQTNAVSVLNAGNIVTFGADAPAIVAQSIGGGGGVGGKAASSLGSSKSTGDGGNGSVASVSATAATLSNALNSGGLGALAQYNSVSGLNTLANAALGNVPLAAATRLGDDPASDAAALETTGQSAGNSGDGSTATYVSLAVLVGGQGGYGGTGEQVYVHNTGGIGTIGTMSDGILAQSIGGGGGKAGAAISSSPDVVIAGSSISVGGSGGNGGTSNQVTVTNDGSIITIGGLAAGIVAQSIAGGGGIGGVSGAKPGSSGNSVLQVPITIGATGGDGGSAGTVLVTNNGTIITSSHDAIGIIGQSIAGGGGIVKTLSSDAADNDGGGASPNGGDYGINLTFTGSSSASGTANLVNIQNPGSINTSGRNAYGILAQSIGGGGGLVLGGKPNGASFFGSGTATGDGGPVTVETGGAITTAGTGAVGILAQSIGGSGGLAGDTGWTEQLGAFHESGTYNGNGNTVTVTVDATGSVITTGFAAPAILVQSLGGGGGRVSNTIGAFNGTLNGAGNGGQVNITVNGTVQATGPYSAGIYAQSAGQGGVGTPGAISVTVGGNALVSGGHDGGDGMGSPGIWIDGGSTSSGNLVTNNGTITSAMGTSGTAIRSQNGVTNVENNGTITGSLSGTSNGSSNVVNHLGATFNSGAVLSLNGSFRNQGTLNIGGSGAITKTTLTGSFVQEASGTLLVDADHAAGQADQLNVVGSATVAGTISVHAVTLAKRPVTVLTASGDLAIDPALTGTRTQLFDFMPVGNGNSLQIQPQADFRNPIGGGVTLNDTQSQVAGYLQSIWDSGSALGGGFSVLLAGVSSPASYTAALNNLSGQSLGAIAASRFAASRGFISNLYSCPAYAPGSMQSAESDCAWVRILGNQTSQNNTADALGYTASSTTTQIAGQKQFAQHWFLGASIAYERSQFSGAESTSSVTGDGMLAGAVIKYEDGPWLFSGGLDTGYGWYSSSRLVGVGNAFAAIAKADPTAWHAGVSGRVAYQIPFETWYLKPALDLHAAYVGSGAYTESGAAPFNLAVQSVASGAVAATAAIEVGTIINFGRGGRVRPYASVGVGALSTDGWAATARFAGAQDGSSFRASTPLPTVVGRFAAGVDLYATENWGFKLQYTGDVGGSYQSHTGSARLSWSF